MLRTESGGASSTDESAMPCLKSRRTPLPVPFGIWTQSCLIKCSSLHGAFGGTRNFARQRRLPNPRSSQRPKKKSRRRSRTARGLDRINGSAEQISGEEDPWAKVSNRHASYCTRNDCRCRRFGQLELPPHRL